MTVVAYQGEPGAYGEEGARSLLPDAEHATVPSVRRIFEAVEVGRADYGLAPMDNSQAGSINETYDLFLKHGLHMVGETVVRVDHCLLGLPGTHIDDLTDSGEGEVALTMTEFMLRQLGATAEQIDRAGDRTRSELFGTPQTVELLLPLPQKQHAEERPAGEASSAEQDETSAKSSTSSVQD